MSSPTPETGKVRRILVAGGTGLIGSHLCRHLLDRGDEVIILTRDPNRATTDTGGAALLPWQPGSQGAWTRELDGVDAVVDMAGAPFFTRWKGDYYRTEVLGSRIEAIETLLAGIRSAQTPPATFISGSSVGAYGYRRSNDELTESSPPGDDFWSRDTLALEQRAARAKRLGVRVVQLRTGIVLARQGGALAGQLEQFRRGFGGTILPGSQWFPWIHIADVARLIARAIDDPAIDGALNATSPNPVRYRTYAATLARCVRRSAPLPIPGWILRRALGPAATTITHGRRIVPEKALQTGHTFSYPTLEAALEHLIHSDRAAIEPRPNRSPA